MPAFFDEAQIASGLDNIVQPAIERLASNPLLRERELRRFDEDEPPPYESSTEPDDEAPFLPAPWVLSSLKLNEIEEIRSEPFNDEERRHLAWTMRKYYYPGEIYAKQAIQECYRIQDWVRSKANKKTREFLQPGKTLTGFDQNRPSHRRRIEILARRNMKRRWQKMGVWNPAWGFPEHLTDNFDESRQWQWAWQKDEWESLDPDHPVFRAIDLRKDLGGHVHVPQIPRPFPQPNATVSERESFIISRPWFVFNLEQADQAARTYRLESPRQEQYLDHIRSDPETYKVKDIWKACGEWKQEWTDQDFIGWRWASESDLPEPEDLSQFNDLDNLELTPSEVDALDDVPPPTPPSQIDYGPPITVPMSADFVPIFGPLAAKRLYQGDEESDDGSVDADNAEASGGEQQPPTPPELPEPEPEPPAPPSPSPPPPSPPPPPPRRRRQPANANDNQPLRRSARIAAKAAEKEKQLEANFRARHPRRVAAVQPVEPKTPARPKRVQKKKRKATSAPQTKTQPKTRKRRRG